MKTITKDIIICESWLINWKKKAIKWDEKHEKEVMSGKRKKIQWPMSKRVF